MEWIAALRGSIVALDTAPLIYFIEEHPHYLPKIRPFFEALQRGEFHAVTSLVTLVEVLVQPLRKGRIKLADEYRQILLQTPGLTAVAIDESVAEKAAELRATYNVRTPDAIQLATAVVARASWILTNDAELVRVPGVTTLVLKDLPPTVS